MVQNKTSSAKALQTFVAVAVCRKLTRFGFMTTPTAEAASGFYVSGTSIYDANGNKFVMRGVNIAHAWYTEKTETSIKGAANNGANTVRARKRSKVKQAHKEHHKLVQVKQADMHSRST